MGKHEMKKQSGFTLIELAVVLGVVSALVLGSMTLLKEQKVDIEQDVAEGRLDVVKTALLRFVEKNNYLPCPDANEKGEAGFGTGNRVLNQSASFAAIPATLGRSAQAATASSPFIPAVPDTPAQPARAVNVDTCSVNAGTVPFETIGLSLKDVTDEKHHLFHYVVNQGVTVAKNMADCPVDSACFFNRNSAPAFDYSTEPVAGRLGANNLRVCSETDCAGAALLNDGLVAVVLAYNHNANHNATGLSAEEQENLDNDKTFIKKNYVREGEAYFDDQLVSISGAELKRGERKEFQRNSSVQTPTGNTSLSGNDLVNMGDTRVGGVGTNVWTDDVIWDTAEQTFSFGEEAANKEIVLTYDSYAIGTWDQPGGYNPLGVTSDTAKVSSNGELVKEYKYEYRDNTQTGRVEVTYRDVANDPDGDSTITRTVDYWEDSTEVVLKTDSEGNIKLEFAVGTTANYETIDFSNIELMYYNTPPSIPDFPLVEPVSGITQTEDL